MSFLGPLMAIGQGVNSALNLGKSIYNGFGDLTGLYDTTDMRNAKEMSDYEFKQQLALMEQSNSYAVQQWNRENDYNSPVSQLARLRQAGLNPLFHGLDGNTAGGLSSVNTPAAPSIGSSWGASAAASRLRMEEAMFAEQLKNLKADTTKKEREGEKIEAETEGQNLSNANVRVELHYNQAKENFDFNVQTPLLDEQGNVVYNEDGTPVMVSNFDNKLQNAVHQMNVSLKKSYKQFENDSYETAMKKIQSDHFEQEYMTRLEKLGYERDTAKLGLDLYRAQIALTKAKTATEKAAAQELMTRAQLNIQNAAKAKAETGLIGEQTETEKERRENIKEDTKVKQTQGELNKANTGESKARTVTEGFKQSNYGANTEYVSSMTEGQKIQNEIESDMKTWTEVSRVVGDVSNWVGQGVGVATQFTPTGAIGNAMKKTTKIGFNR